MYDLTHSIEEMDRITERIIFFNAIYINLIQDFRKIELVANLEKI